MSPVLICAATREELEAFGLGDAAVLEEGRLWQIPGGVLAATGAGIPVTLLRLLPLLDRFRPGLIVNTGIAGAYLPSLPSGPGSGATLAIGDVVIGTSEVFADLGMERPDEEAFRPLGAFPFADEALRAPLPLAVPAWAASISGLKRGRGATVNACAGTDATGALRRRLFLEDGGAGFESMEGAAFALAGLERGIPVIEIRAVSNMAARRDVRPGNIARALDALRAFWTAHRGRMIGAGVDAGAGAGA